MKYQTIFWDFNGVLSHDLFYKPLKTSHPKVWDFIQTNIFGSQSKGKVSKWMRADLNIGDINKLIVQKTGINPEVLNLSLTVGSKNFEIETGHIPIAKELKKMGVKVGLVTDNMDVFDLFVRPNFDFESIFDVIINSFTYKKLKIEGLFEIAMKAIGSTDYSRTLLIEDSANSINYFKTLGGDTYSYTTFENFHSWADKNLLKQYETR
jgi:FMN phosphatase YigB (HAD superfamily)